MPLTQNKACVSFAESNEYRDRTQSSKMNIHHECWMQLDSDIAWETVLFLVLIAMWSVENSWNQRLITVKILLERTQGMLSLPQVMVSVLVNKYRVKPCVRDRDTKAEDTDIHRQNTDKQTNTDRQPSGWYWFRFIHTEPSCWLQLSLLF